MRPFQFFKIQSGVNKANWMDEYERDAPRRGTRAHIGKETASKEVTFSDT